MPLHYQYEENSLRSVVNRTFLRWRPHFHSSVEVVYLRSGGSIAQIDEKEYLLAPDDLLIVFPQQIHSYREDNHPDCMVMFIPLDYLSDFRDLLSRTLPTDPILHNASHFPHLLELFPHIRQACQNPGTYNNVVLNGYLAAFMGQLLDHFHLESTRNIEFSPIHAMLRYCALHYTEPLTLNTLSNALHLHRSYLSTIFSQQLRISFNDYLNSLRIEEACRLLRITNDSVTNIAFAVGFDNTRTFNRAFQRICNSTPSEYRKTKKSG